MECSPKYDDNGQCDSGDEAKFYWPDDVLDDLDKELRQFILLARDDLLTQNLDNLVKEFDVWYDEKLALWIEGSDSAHCFVCDPNHRGKLYVLRDKMEAMRKRLEDWSQKTSYTGSSCEEVWCVPPRQDTINDYGIKECGGVSFDEAQRFTLNGDPAKRGDMEDVVACLNWNINDPVPGATLPYSSDELGNENKFRLCGEHCNKLYCDELPRSLLPRDDYVPSEYTAGDSRDEPDIQSMLNCFDHCSNANCQSMPEVKTSDGITLYFDASHDPDTFNAGTDCAGNAPTGGWDEAIIAALKIAGPSCDLSAGGWLADTRQSAREAANQVVKFEQRRDFLDKRLVEIEQITGILHEAIDHFDAFLNDPALIALIQARKDLSAYNANLPNLVIYGWQDKLPPQGSDRGYWHLVRIDAAIPGQCGGSCNVDQDPSQGDPPLPKVCAKDPGLFENCFEMCETDGVIKYRTTRWDEERGSKTLVFPQGIPVGKFRLFHPGRGDVPQQYLNQLENCFSDEMTLDNPPAELLPPEGYDDMYRGAFILNSWEQVHTDPIQTRCWFAATKVLSYGITSAACAKYYEHGGLKPGMGFHFVPCKNW